MGPLFRLSLACAALFAILKIILFQTGKHESFYMRVVFGNIIMMLMSMSGGLFQWRKQQKKASTYADDVKTTMKSAALYVLFASSFAYLYYTKIDPQSVQERIQVRVTQAEAQDFEELKKVHPEQLKSKTRHDFIEDERKFAAMIFSPFFMSTVMMISGLLLGFFYSLLIAWFWRRFIDKASVFE
ncbi:MAG: DUF4199 family protein [Flavobacteriales bacterium]